MNLVALIKPSRKIYDEVKNIKSKVFKKYGKQMYIDHLPHITIFDLKIKKSLLTKKYRSDLKIKNLKQKDLNLLVKKRHFFKSDPITKKCTYVIFIKKNLLLKKIQTKLLKKFSYIKKIKNIKFNNKEFAKNNKIFGYPFVNNSWKPHITIVSIDKKNMKDSLFNKFLSIRQNHRENFRFIHFYKYNKGKHIFLWKSKIINDK